MHPGCRQAARRPSRMARRSVSGCLRTSKAASGTVSKSGICIVAPDWGAGSADIRLILPLTGPNQPSPHGATKRFGVRSLDGHGRPFGQDSCMTPHNPTPFRAAPESTQHRENKLIISSRQYNKLMWAYFIESIRVSSLAMRRAAKSWSCSAILAIS